MSSQVMRNISVVELPFKLWKTLVDLDENLGESVNQEKALNFTLNFQVTLRITSRVLPVIIIWGQFSFLYISCVISCVYFIFQITSMLFAERRFLLREKWRKTRYGLYNYIARTRDQSFM